MTTNTITQHAVDRYSKQVSRAYHMTTPALDIAEDLDNLLRRAAPEDKIEVTDSKATSRRTWLVLIPGAPGCEYLIAVLRGGLPRQVVVTGAVGFSGLAVEDVMTTEQMRDRVRTHEYRVVGKVSSQWADTIGSVVAGPVVDPTPKKPARLSPGLASQEAARNKDAREAFVRELFRQDISRPLQGARGIDELVRAKFDNVGMSFYTCLRLRDEVQKIARPGSGRPTARPADEILVAEAAEVAPTRVAAAGSVTPAPAVPPADRLFLDLQEAVQAEAAANHALETAEQARRAASERTATLLSHLTERRLGREVAAESAG